MQPSSTHQKEVLVLPADDLSAGPNESRWRAHGMARRRKLLEEDQRIGGRDFSMSFDCSVQRYFSVAHWALEQFHQLYQKATSSSTNYAKELEELYLMGHRIVSFLTKCLPRHPGLGRAHHVRQQSKQELDNLQKCLESVALLIDEHVCNQFVDDGDFFLDSMLAAEMDEEDDDEDEKTSATRSTAFRTPKKAKQCSAADRNWLLHFPEDELELVKANTSKCVSFAEQKQDGRKSAESPTADTVGTCGTESLEPTDSSYTNCDSPNSRKGNQETLHRADSEATDDDDDGSITRSITRDYDDDDTFDIDELSEDDWEGDLDLELRRPMSVMRGVRLDFLRTIACEPVLYETDSEAADSWANTVEDVLSATNSHPCLPSSSGVTPTCDPARIAFRELMTKLPHESILRRNNQPKLLLASPPSTSNPLERSPSSSPTLTDILGELDTGKTSGVEYTNFDDILENEIKEYLDSSKTDEDPTQFVETCHENRNTKSKGTGSSKIHRQHRRDDRSQISSHVSSSSSSSSATVGSTSSSSSLKSLANKTGSKTSAFSSFSRPKHQQPRERESITSAFIFDLDDWISFDNSTGNSYFADSPF
mmetsp:Transcript_19318/g.42014  ORF Transcript_19318/g.42014 Transcript_19318/m.42014 type:complete len:594 (+) Transcript_19318:527-2308(+)